MGGVGAGVGTGVGANDGGAGVGAGVGGAGVGAGAGVGGFVPGVARRILRHFDTALPLLSVHVYLIASESWLSEWNKVLNVE